MFYELVPGAYITEEGAHASSNVGLIVGQAGCFLWPSKLSNILAIQQENSERILCVFHTAFHSKLEKVEFSIQYDAEVRVVT